MSDFNDYLRVETLPEHFRSTSPFLSYSIIRRFLTDEVLNSGHDEVTRAVKIPRDVEGLFTDPLSDRLRLCRGIFSKSDFSTILCMNSNPHLGSI